MSMYISNCCKNFAEFFDFCALHKEELAEVLDKSVDKIELYKFLDYDEPGTFSVLTLVNRSKDIYLENKHESIGYTQPL